MSALFGGADLDFTDPPESVLHYAADGSSDRLHASCGESEENDTAKFTLRLREVTCVECLQSVIRIGKHAAERLAVIEKPVRR